MPPASQLLPLTQGPRLIVYAQTYHDPEGTYTSLLPLITSQSGITHVIIAAIHLNHGPGNITLNDDPPEASKFETLWGEVRWLQGAGVKVMGMLGGAAKGSYERLSRSDEEFEEYYEPLEKLVRDHSLDGLDLDIEEQIPLTTATRLILRLRADFGPSFIITLAPVATALIPDPRLPPPPRPILNPSGPMPNPLHPTLPHLSGFSYPELENHAAGKEVSWYNTQFYCGWGDAGSTQWYDAIIAAGWSPDRVVLGVVTNPANGAGHVSINKFREVCRILRSRYDARGGFGGVMGWEYFNAGQGEQDSHEIGTLDLSISHPQASWVSALSSVLRSAEPMPAPPAPNRFNVNADQIRQMLTSLPEPPVPWPSESIQNLVEIGFSRQEAVAALNATDGNVELAAGLLFEH